MTVKIENKSEKYYYSDMGLPANEKRKIKKDLIYWKILGNAKD
jgi:hypothetical protein